MLVGHIDEIHDDHIIGWCHETNCPDEKIEVILLYDGKEVARNKADKKRKDLETFVPGGDLSFNFEYPKVPDAAKLDIVLSCSLYTKRLSPVPEDRHIGNLNAGELQRMFGKLYSVNPEIHPEDLIYEFIRGNRCFDKDEDILRYYFNTGHESSQRLVALLEHYFPEKIKEGNLSLLEFASGFGCVTRHLAKFQEKIEVTACDIHPKAISFIKENFGTKAIQSASLPEDLKPGKKFDCVFALSFFSHMPARTWERWLRSPFNCVREKEGILIFTTQGLASRKYFGYPAFPRSGFIFRPESEQTDLDTAEYGNTLVTPDFVFKILSLIDGAELLEFRQGIWWGHQDMYVVGKRG